MKKRFGSASVFAVLIGMLTLYGCSTPEPEPEPQPEPQPEKLSYSEALQVYNQELIALDRLKAEREKLQQSLNPDALGVIGGLLEQAVGAEAELQNTLDDLGAVPPVEGDDVEGKFRECAHEGDGLNHQ